MSELWQLFITFFKIGAFTFGGGYAMLPFLEKEISEKKKWATEEELLDCFAIGQSTPGVIAVNTATLIGYRKKGVMGAFSATLGVILPSIIIITIIAALIQNFLHYEIVQHAFAGIRVAVAVLICNAVIKFWKTGVKDWKGLIILLVVLALSFFTSITTVWILLSVILLGILTVFFQNRKEGKQ